MLTSADLAPIGQPVGPGRPTGQVVGGGLKTATCHWSLGKTSFVELTVWVLSDQYAGPKDFANRALQTAAESASTTVEHVAGVGDDAGIEIPPTPGNRVSAEFYAQRGPVVIKMEFQGTSAATWPTAAQLTEVGKAAAATIF